MSTIYLAGGWADRERVKALAAELAEHGYKQTYEWWSCSDDGMENEVRHHYLRECAFRDLAGVAQADCFVFCYNDTLTTRGAWVELGFALAHGKRCIIFAPDAPPEAIARLMATPWLNLHTMDLVTSKEALLAALGAERASRGMPPMSVGVYEEEEESGGGDEHETGEASEMHHLKPLPQA